MFIYVHTYINIFMYLFIYISKGRIVTASEMALISLPNSIAIYHYIHMFICTFLYAHTHIYIFKGRIVTASEMALVSLPNSIAIIGGGVIAVEYATVFSQLGVGVSLICSDSEFLPFLENEMRQSLKKRMSKDHILFVREKIREIQIGNDSISVVLQKPSEGDLDPRAKGRAGPERKLKVDLVLYSGGRNANSEGLGLEQVMMMMMVMMMIMMMMIVMMITVMMITIMMVMMMTEILK
jgi:pyruvate/2-oxoglutarate dehydrogenase complex dihydrolipoamide dehydrogenase (E3) component